LPGDESKPEKIFRRPEGVAPGGGIMHRFRTELLDQVPDQPLQSGLLRVG
jgi:hypothetical protein